MNCLLWITPAEYRTLVQIGEWRESLTHLPRYYSEAVESNARDAETTFYGDELMAFLSTCESVQAVVIYDGRDLGRMGLNRARLPASVAVRRSSIEPENPQHWESLEPLPFGFEPTGLPDHAAGVLQGTVPASPVQEAEFRERWESLKARIFKGVPRELPTDGRG